MRSKIENLKDNPLFGEISFFNLVLVLVKHFKFILLIPLMITLSVIIYVQFFAEIIYTSEAKIISSSSKSSNSQALSLASQFGINLSSQGSDPNWVYPEILKSRTLAKSILNKKFNSKEFDEKTFLKYIIGSKMGFRDFESKESLTMIVNKFISMIEVAENLKTNIYTLKISSSEPELSADIADSLIVGLDTYQRKYNRGQLQQTKVFIKQRIKETGSDLNFAEDKLNIFRTRNRGIQNSPSLQLQEQRFLREVNVLTQVFTSLKQQLENSKIDEVREKNYVLVIDKPEVPINRSKPKKKQLVLMASIMSLFISILLSLGFEFLKVTISKNDILKINIILETLKIR